MKSNNAVLVPVSQYISTLNKIELIPLSQLMISPTNPRKTFSPEKIESIAGDIRQNGLMHPITIRKIKKDKYEIVVGSRRFRGYSFLAETDPIYDAIPAFVRELTDNQVIEMQFSENLQREDVEPLEEASSFKFYIEERGFSVQELAERLNHNVNYVYRRLCLNNLSEKCKAIYEKGNMTLGIANLIARLPEKEQDTLLKTIAFNNSEKGEYIYKTEEQVKSEIASLTLFLKDAPFDTSNQTLTGGSCLTCPKNTGCNKLLFPEITDESKCTDRACFKAKTIEFKDIELPKYKAQYNGTGIFICDTWASKDELAKKHKKINPDSFINYQMLDNYEVLTEPEPDTKPAFILECERWGSKNKGLVNRVVHIREIPKPDAKALAEEEKEIEEDTPNEIALANYEAIRKNKIEYMIGEMSKLPVDFQNTGWLRLLFNILKNRSSFDCIQFYKDNFLNTDKSFKSVKKELQWTVEFDNIKGHTESTNVTDYIAAKYKEISDEVENYDPKNNTCSYSVRESIERYVIESMSRENLIDCLNEEMKIQIDHWWQSPIIIACAVDMNIPELEGDPTLL